MIERKYKKINMEAWSEDTITHAMDASAFKGLIRCDFKGEINQTGDRVHVKIQHTGKTRSVWIHSNEYFVISMKSEEEIAERQEELSVYYGKKIARKLDRDVVALSSRINTIPSVTLEAGIKQAIYLLDRAGVPEDDRYMVIDLGQKELLYSMDEFISAKDIGGATTHNNGYIGQIHGVSVYASEYVYDSVSQREIIVFHRDAFALCVRPKLIARVQYDIEMLMVHFVSTILYGTDILVPGFAVKIIY